MLVEYNVSIVYCSGKENIITDALSRNPSSNDFTPSQDEHVQVTVIHTHIKGTVDRRKSEPL